MSNSTIKKSEVLLAISCSLVYALSYTCRLNYSAAMPYILEENYLTRTQEGAFSLLYFLAYGVGQFVNGFSTDVSNPRPRVIFGMFGIALSNMLLLAFPSHLFFGLLWTINGIFQSMLWSPCYSLLVNYLNENTGYIILLNMATGMGSLLSYFLSLVLVAHFSWKSLFVAPGFICFLGAVTFIIISRYSLKNLKGKSSTESKAFHHPQKTSARLHSFGHLLAASGVLIFVPSIVIHGMMKDGVTTWLPTLMHEAFDIKSDSAIAVSVIPQIFNLMAPTLAYWLYKRAKSEVKTAIVLFSIVTGCLVGIMGSFRTSGILTVLFLSTIILCMQAANVVYLSQVPVHFSNQGMLATFSGFSDSIAYIGCAISMSIVAFISDSGGWTRVIVFWLFSSITALLFLLISKKKWALFTNKG